MADEAVAISEQQRLDEMDQQNPDLVAPEDEIVGEEISAQHELAVMPEGRQVLAEGVVMDAANFEKIVVNGVELTVDSSLAALRSGCNFYGISQSGGKSKCYRRLVNHLKALELELLKNAAQHAAAEVERVPHAPTLATPPSLEVQRKHELTHMPYQPWCESCVCFKARSDRQCRDDSARVSGTPTVSFDLAYTHAFSPRGSQSTGNCSSAFSGDA